MRSILHVDRSEFFQGVIADICKPLNFEYRTANSRVEAIHQIGEKRPDLILSALELPDCTGLEFIRELKEGPVGDIPVVVITSSDSLEMRKELFSMGVADYVLKTLPREQLLQSIKETMTPSGASGGVDEHISRLNIAVLDDSRFEREVMRSILEMNHFQNVKTFEFPQDLIRSTEEFDLYLIDMVLPDFSGEHVIRSLKQAGRKGMIIAVSGVDDSRAVSNVLLSGADDYITKPFDAVIFTARIRATGRTIFLLKELEQKNLALRKLAITDGLTGLYNRRHLYSLITKEFESSKRPSGIIFFDLDFFKRINDTYGHPEGDLVLKNTAAVIRKEAIPVGGKPGRSGGEEFAVFLPGFDSEATMKLAEQIRKNVSLLKFRSGVKVTVSGGAACRVLNETTGEFLYRADQALYKAKSNGRNQILLDCPGIS